jgi:hypothetical protein
MLTSDKLREERMTQLENSITRIQGSINALHEQFNHLFLAILAVGLTAIYFTAR